ncbi:MAG: phenylalanine--tRNA ligase subunit beta, partial [Clostridia bacterium]|nr:phenylalanine--tRNA ligase subunit beta [Clostridia bacterium]
MNISLSWLKKYVDIDVPVEELCEKMIRSGFEVESMVDLSESMKNIVVGQVVSMEKHPDSDHIWICQVNVGAAEPVQIITGAQNVFEGAFVPAALHNSYLPDGTHITKGKLRGLPSNGMLCSGEELGLKAGDYPGCDVYGIMIMDDAYAPGTDICEVLHLDDYIIDFKITANRPDCNCVMGVAREAAVALGKEFREPKPAYTCIKDSVDNYIKVRVDDYDLCPRYMGRIVRNLRIKESPDWMKQCLKAAGMRPINNIVDITNYVLLETGHPMHAFDLRDIAGGQIIVRRAKNGENITTLDGKEYTLTDEMLVIADEKAPSCLAGIMGGLNSEIKEDTKDLFFECAKFRRDNVRRTARTLGVRTESSARFERGVDVIGVEYAMNRALQLIEELDAGDIVDGTVDLHDGLPSPRVLKVPAARVNALLGINVPFETI